jgi:hypothetical protein
MRRGQRFESARRLFLNRLDKANTPGRRYSFASDYETSDTTERTRSSLTHLWSSLKRAVCNDFRLCTQSGVEKLMHLTLDTMSGALKVASLWPLNVPNQRWSPKRAPRDRVATGS